jgi:hypothetical protein
MKGESMASDFNIKAIEDFRANNGKVGGQFEGMTLVLVNTVGSKAVRFTRSRWHTFRTTIGSISLAPALAMHAILPGPPT